MPAILVMLLGILIILLIAYLVQIVIQKYVPIDPQIKQVVIAIIWLCAVVGIILRVWPVLAGPIGL